MLLTYLFVPIFPLISPLPLSLEQYPPIDKDFPLPNVDWLPIRQLQANSHTFHENKTYLQYWNLVRSEDTKRFFTKVQSRHFFTKYLVSRGRGVRMRGRVQRVKVTAPQDAHGSNTLEFSAIRR